MPAATATMTDRDRNMTAATPQKGRRPEEHRRPKKKSRPYPLTTYPALEVTKILMQENRVKTASLVSSVASQLALYPMDSIKTRMQVYKFSSVFDCLREIKRTEGLRSGLYRGIIGPTVSYSIVRMITFEWYANMKYNIDDAVTAWTGESILVQVNTPGSRPTFMSTACFTVAGAITGFGVSFLACPFELLKVGRQMSGMLGKGNSLDETLGKTYRDKGTLSAGWDLYRRVGIKGLYSGIHLHAIRDTVGTGIFWGSYEGMKQLLSVSRGGSPDSPVAGGIAGGFCGMLAYLCAYPIDTVKTVYQQKCLFAKDGQAPKSDKPIRWFGREQFRGLPITMTRVFFSNLIQMWIFEWMKKEIRGFDVDPPPPPRASVKDPLD